jgi:elongation of very long chain fatty acids protein 4
LAIIHAFHSLYIDCNFPKWMHYTLIGYAISFILLFTNFYYHTYIKRGRKKARTSKDVAATPLANGVVSSNGHGTWSHGNKKKDN